MSNIDELTVMGADMDEATAKVQAMTDEEWAVERTWLIRVMRSGQVPADLEEIARTTAAASRFADEIGDDLGRSAVHEAGHAVAAHATGWTVEFVEPEMSDGIGGGARTWQNQAARPTARDLWHEYLGQVVVGVAGCVAEELEFGLAIPFEAMQLADHSRVQFAVPDEQIPALIEQGEDRARRILMANWPVVRHLADAQLDRGRIEGGELAAILAGVMAEPRLGEATGG